MKPVIFIIIDGLADQPLKGKTPLSAASKPNIDWFASNGYVGELNLLPKSMWTELTRASVSHIANLALLGYNPKRYELKGGPLEAVGADIPYKQGHLALRCNFATVDKQLIVKDRHAGRNSYGLNEIARSINAYVDINVPYTFLRTYEHRAVLVIKRSLSDAISSNDPLYTGKKVKKISATKPDALLSAKLVQDFVDQAHNIIEFHRKNAERIEKGIPPANYLLVRGMGNSLPTLPSFLKKWKLKKAVCIAEAGVMKATCMLAGFSAITVPEFTIKGKTNQEKTLDFIFDTIEDSLSEYPFVYAHIKGADEAAHDKDFNQKKRVIEAIDKRIERFKHTDCILIVTCDHITSCITGKHEAGKVPLLLYGIGKDRVKSFDEISAKKGKLENFTGNKLWKLVFKKNK